MTVVQFATRVGKLAFKIYKKSRGRKHGPYFYKNIRTKDGVKRVSQI